jgi:hypothetical protein
MRYSQNLKIGKPNNLNFESNETKGHKQDTVFFVFTLKETNESSIFQSFWMNALSSVIVQSCSQTSMTIKCMFMVSLSQFHFSQRSTGYHRLSCKIAFVNSAMCGHR